MTLPEQLTPPKTKGHVSVARLARHWYVACRSSELGEAPIARTILGVPLVLFRNAQNRAAALLDRCPHRNVPLSLGRIANSGNLECRYHGWQFDGTGQCRVVPGLVSDAPSRDRRCPSAAVREQEGLVWVYPSLDDPPDCEPFEIGLGALANHTVVVREVLAPATLHATLENALDVPHTAFLHRGLFRSDRSRNEIRVRVRRSANSVEAEYLGEPRPSGLAGKLLSPSGGTVQHWDRFFLPSIAQVEYRLGPETHFIVTALCTPVSDFVTRLTAVTAFRTLLPGRLLKILLEPVALRIFAQDARVLRRQTENIQRFGGEQYMSTELDVLGTHIWRLLRQAERGETPETVVESELRMFV